MTLLLSLLGCIRDVAPGPDPGACAELPDGVYTYGELGIGTCLAGPTDVRFFEQDGGTFLGVTNADPFRIFRSGSFLVLDWDEIEARLDAGAPDRLPIDELTAHVLEISDDDDGDGVGDNPYLGGFGYQPASQSVVLTSRYSETGVLRDAQDDLFVADLSRMELPGGGIELLGSLILEDDPQPVAVDGSTGRTYVGNLSDHSISVLTDEVAPGARFPVAEVDVAEDAELTPAVLTDADSSGSFAELTKLAIGDPRSLVEDRFTLSFVDASVRLWVPTVVGEDSQGLVRWGSGGGEYTPSAFGLEDGLGEIRDPFGEVGVDGLPILWFARQDGTIRRAIGNYVGGDWVTEESTLITGGIHSGPSAAPLPDGIGLWTDVREAPGEAASIALSTSPDGAAFERLGEVLVPPEGESYEDPFTVYDPSAQRWRMWLSIHRGNRWVVALSESADGEVWSRPVDVLHPPGRDAAAPSVGVLDGRYGMWLTLGDGTRWDHAFAWSYDGWTWSEPEVVVDGELAYDPDVPPRAAVEVSRVGAWRVEGIDQGQLPSLLPGGATGTLRLFGIDMAIASGHEVDNNAVGHLRAELGLIPGSVNVVGGRTFLYATAIGAGGRSRLAVLEWVGGEWIHTIDSDPLEDALGVAPAEQLSSPVLVEDGARWVLFATLTDDDGARLVRATTTDGLAFTELDRAPVLTGPTDGWDAAGEFAHSVEVLPDGIRLWYAGDDGSRRHIGSAFASSPSVAFEREPGPVDGWRFGTGVPGSFDDSSVADPVVVTLDGVTHLYYAGFDGTSWHLGHAELDGDRFVRRTDPVTDLSIPAMNGLERTFSANGVESPTLFAATPDGRLEWLYAGRDALARRVGFATVDPRSLDVVYANQRFPTPGDTLTFSSTRGVYGTQVVELAQSTQWYVTSGFGMSGITLDEPRGFLYVPSKLYDEVSVVDVRDDSTGSFVDQNALDLETLIRIESGTTGSGYRDAVVSQTRSLLYLTQRQPDALVVVDLARVDDDDSKAPVDTAAVAVLPFPDLSVDEGADTLALIGGAGMALSADERMLYVTHFRQNALSVIDLQREPWGQEIAWIPSIGENPHVVRLSPDQRYAVVANYVGEVEESGLVSSNLAVVDIDPDSERYLEVVTWLVNR